LAIAEQISHNNSNGEGGPYDCNSCVADCEEGNFTSDWFKNYLPCCSKKFCQDGCASSPNKLNPCTPGVNYGRRFRNFKQW
jgi:hypothetical protein